MVHLVHVVASYLGYAFAGIGVYTLMTAGKANRGTAGIVAIGWVLISIYLRVIENKALLDLILSD